MAQEDVLRRFDNLGLLSCGNLKPLIVFYALDRWVRCERDAVPSATPTAT